MHKRLIFITFVLAGFFAVSSCSGFEEEASSSESVSVSSGGKVRPSVLAVLQKFSDHNGTNAVTFNYLSATTDVTSGVKTLTPTLNAYYVAEGFEFDFASNWDAGRSDFGYVTVPAGNSHAVSAGLYEFSLDAAGKLALGAQETSGSASDEAYRHFNAYTPQYLYDNAERLAPLFETTSRTEYNSLNPATSTLGATQADVDAVAKALNVYGILTAADSNITISYVDLYYTATTSTYTFNFYVDYAGIYGGSSASSVSKSPLLGARAKLGSFGTTSVPVIAAYLA